MKFSTNINALLAIFCASVMLSSCANQMFGMDEDQFNQLTPAQKQQVIASYNKRQEIHEQNKPAEDLISMIGTQVVPAIAGNKSHETTHTTTTTSSSPTTCHMEGSQQVCKSSSVSNSKSFSTGFEA